MFMYVATCTLYIIFWGLIFSIISGVECSAVSSSYVLFMKLLPRREHGSKWYLFIWPVNCLWLFTSKTCISQQPACNIVCHLPNFYLTISFCCMNLPQSSMIVAEEEKIMSKILPETMCNNKKWQLLPLHRANSCRLAQVIDSSTSDWHIPYVIKICRNMWKNGNWQFAQLHLQSCVQVEVSWFEMTLFDCTRSCSGSFQGRSIMKWRW